MTTSAPTGRSSRLHRRRYSPAGAAVSSSHVTTLPSGIFTSTYRCPCGFDQSMRLIVPRSVIGLLASYCAANEWCAWRGATQSAADTTMANVSFRIIRNLPLPRLLCRIVQVFQMLEIDVPFVARVLEIEIDILRRVAQLHVRRGKTHRPRPCEHFRIGDRCLPPHRTSVDHPVAFDDLRRVADDV